LNPFLIFSVCRKVYTHNPSIVEAGYKHKKADNEILIFVGLSLYLFEVRPHIHFWMEVEKMFSWRRSCMCLGDCEIL
jgi:hypothetical protein